ncbi:SDR family oxidoreductase [Hyphomicrobium sp. 2TAF46]|uniref:SDR family oxidoreductase n=1 Tax=Hyphomicrobium sp. 2TAF46 TaxID=3233019 RepID=UPI003F903DA3
MDLESDWPARALTGKVAAIPLATTPFGEAITDLVLAHGGRLALGASPAQFEAFDAKIDGREGTHCQHVDLDRPHSLSEFFQIAFAQFERLDVVVLELAFSKRRRMTTEKAIEAGTRRLLYCLDAVLPYIGRDLHFICVGPASGPAVIPITTAFLAAKFATTRKTPAPRIRMSIVSPPEESAAGEVALARAVVHLMKEARSPDILETVLSPRPRPRRQPRLPRFDARSKLCVQA